ncbi:MAG: hypothetical protein KGV44_00805 [Flavobacteriaceae bacterium]|nr:hypothetical protein [Flavobacteriaceae bacterium]
MNLQIFPNWCKKVGIAIFTIFFCFEGRDSFMEGWYAYEYKLPLGADFSLKEHGLFSFQEYFGSKLMFIFGILSYIGMLIYMFSKEKVEDDFINKLRLESYQLSLVGVIIIGLICHILGLDAEFGLELVISLLLTSYLIIFAIKKRSI